MFPRKFFFLRISSTARGDLHNFYTVDDACGTFHSCHSSRWSEHLVRKASTYWMPRSQFVHRAVVNGSIAQTAIGSGSQITSSRKRSKWHSCVKSVTGPSGRTCLIMKKATSTARSATTITCVILAVWSRRKSLKSTKVIDAKTPQALLAIESDDLRKDPRSAPYSDIMRHWFMLYSLLWST